jgi:hypothetical protein
MSSLKGGRVNMRIEIAKLGRWKIAAARAGQSLSDWIEAQCDLSAELKDVVIAAAKQKAAKKPVPPAVRQEVTLPSLEAKCKHGRRHGELCYKCDEQFGYPIIL